MEKVHVPCWLNTEVGWLQKYISLHQRNVKKSACVHVYGGEGAGGRNRFVPYLLKIDLKKL